MRLIKASLLSVFLIVFFPFAVPLFSLSVFLITIIKLVQDFNESVIKEPQKIAEFMMGAQELLLIDEPRPNKTPDLLVSYRENIIEVYNADRVCRILNKEMEDVGLDFKSLEAAKKEIDSVYGYCS